MSNNRRGQTYRPKHKANNKFGQGSHTIEEESFIGESTLDDQDEKYIETVEDFGAIDDIQENDLDLDQVEEESFIEKIENKIEQVENNHAENENDEYLINENEDIVDEFYLLTKEEIDIFNKDMQSLSNKIILEETEEKIDSNEKKQEKLSKNKKSNNILVSNDKEGDDFVLNKSEDKKNIAKNMLDQLVVDLIKFELEIDIVKVMIETENNPSNIGDLQRKIENYQKNIDILYKKKKILNELIESM